MTQPELPLLLLIGDDPSLEYLLKRYALAGGCEFRSLRDLASETDMRTLRPSSIWFASLDVFEASQPVKAVLAGSDVPIVVCTSVFDDTRATELGADYVFLHPITYDCFLSVIARRK
jgi:hypothetical protein